MANHLSQSEHKRFLSLRDTPEQVVPGFFYVIGNCSSSIMEQVQAAEPELF